MLAGSTSWTQQVISTRYWRATMYFSDNESYGSYLYPAILEHRGRRVAEIIEKHLHSGTEWTNLLLMICRTGSIHHDRKLFEFYLSLIDSDLFGTDQDNGRDFWSSLYSCAEKTS